MAVFRSEHIHPNSIAMIPVNGYVNNVNHSPDSIRWLDYVSVTEDIAIQHARNGTGEFKVNGTYVDGYCAETNTIYQFQVS